ncbi:hydroxycarboxylic acid receptor 2 [Parambassis ranga]|uniref:Hydroxycarboxylic acid receptor 2 n=1 Tax=Parambassis ranga TaxID=210632 RepID=A0A6P7JQF9_9TELE|nr:hydroxycarboxylic acid receptor 2-like [Parambassis ranga]
MSNFTSSNCLSDTDPKDTHFLWFVLIVEVVVGVPGSILALWIFCFRMKCWKTHIIFLFNLLMADFLLLIGVPFRIHNHWGEENWVFGQAFCRINLFMLTVNRSASIAFMTVVAVNRYFKVVRPHHCISTMTSTQAVWVSGLMWTAVIAVHVPLLTTDLLHQHNNISLCRSFSSYDEPPWQIKMHYAAFIAEFVLPWFLLLFCTAQIICHLRRRRMVQPKKVVRAIRAVVVIVLVFTFCFMPSVITGLTAMYIKKFYPANCALYSQCTRLFVICIGFTYFNSALDPVIYSFSSSMFLNVLKSSIRFKKNVRAVDTSL